MTSSSALRRNPKTEGISIQIYRSSARIFESLKLNIKKFFFAGYVHNRIRCLNKIKLSSLSFSN